MRKNIVLLIFIFITVQHLQSQTLNCKLNGTLIYDGSYRYAFLYLPDNKSRHITEIIGKRFCFITKKPDELKLGIIFLGKDSSMTYADVVQQRKYGVNESRSVVIEDLEIIIDNDVSKAIVNGGMLNKDNDKMYKAISTSQYDEFFDQNPNSPLALELLKALIIINIKKLPFGGSSAFNIKSYYNKLSDRLRNSEKGKDLKERIKNYQ